MAVPPEETVPRFDQDPVVVASLKAAVDVGTFLIVKKREDWKKDKLGRLMSWHLSIATHDIPARKVLVMKIYETSYAHPGKPIADSTVVSKHMNTATPLAEMLEVSAEEVRDIAFVFPFSVLNDMEYYAQGRMDSFATTEDDVSPFPCTANCFRLSESYAKRVFSGTNKIRVAIMAVLCSTRNDITKKTIRVDISRDTWDYIARQVDTHENVEHQKDYRMKPRVQREILPCMKKMAKRHCFAASRLTFTEADGMDAMSGIFGEASGFGFRIDRPKVGADLIKANQNNRLSYLSHVQMTFAEGQVSIRLSYECYPLKWETKTGPTKGSAKDCPSPALTVFLDGKKPTYYANAFPIPKEVVHKSDEATAAAAAHDARLKRLLRVGIKFPLDGEIYSIVENNIPDHDNMVEIVAKKHGEHKLLMKDVAATLIESYLA